MLESIKIKKLAHAKDLDLPKYKTNGSAGMDLCAAIKDEIIIEKNQYKLIPTGLIINLPIGFEAQIRPRSGLALKNGVTVLNSPGTIDSDYRGEIGLILINNGKEKFVIKHGMRIAQMIISKFLKVSLIEKNNLTKTKRGRKGFGSTGTK